MKHANENGNTPPFDLKLLEKMFAQDVPIMLPEALTNPKSTSWISNYVQQLLNQAKISEDQTSEAKLDYELFQMKKSVICRIFLPEDKSPGSIRIKVSPFVLRIEGYEHPKKRHLIKLPAQIITKGSRAIYDGSVLEIIMPKNLRKRKYRELSIEY